MNSEEQRRKVACWCEAEPGETCRNHKGQKVPYIHATRDTHTREQMVIFAKAAGMPWPR